MGSHVQDDTKTRSTSRFRLSGGTQGGALTQARRSDLVDTSRGAGGVVDDLEVSDSPRPSRLSGAWGMMLSFFIIVVVPTALASVYYGLIASNVYVSESKFAIRGSTEKLPAGGGANAAGPLGGAVSSLSAVNNSQDSYVVASYIKSTPMVEKLDREKDLHAIFARNDIDFIARLQSGSSIEALRRYWETMVVPSVDNISGILTLKVEAFSPQDALSISQAVLAASEALVNEMSKRRLADAVKNANEEVTRAEQRLQAARLAVQAFRNTSGQIDPIKQSESTLTLLSSLRSEQIKLENELATSRRTLTDQSPTIQVLVSRLQAMTDQVKGLERMVTSQTASDQTASRALFQYEGLEVERQFAEKLYLMSEAGLERARMNAARQQLYFVTFVEPNLAERPMYPRRLSNILVVLVCAAAIWSILSLLVATVKDHFV
jgi:capsular polysaccharide transport system permease protein